MLDPNQGTVPSQEPSVVPAAISAASPQVQATDNDLIEGMGRR